MDIETYRHEKNKRSIKDAISFIERYIETHYNSRPGDWILYLKALIVKLSELENDPTKG